MLIYIKLLILYRSYSRAWRWVSCLSVWVDVVAIEFNAFVDWNVGVKWCNISCNQKSVRWYGDKKLFEMFAVLYVYSGGWIFYVTGDKFGHVVGRCDTIGRSVVYFWKSVKTRCATVVSRCLAVIFCVCIVDVQLLRVYLWW